MLFGVLPDSNKLKYLVIRDGAFARIRHPFFFPYRSYARASASDGPAACLLRVCRERQKPKKPLAPDANVSYEPWML